MCEIAIKHMLKCFYCLMVKGLCFPLYVQDHASEAMEVFNELIESEVSIIIPHVADIISFCLEVDSMSEFYYILINAPTNNVFLRADCDTS